MPTITDIFYGDPVYVDNEVIEYPITLKSHGKNNLKYDSLKIDKTLIKYFVIKKLPRGWTIISYIFCGN